MAKNLLNLASLHVGDTDYVEWEDDVTRHIEEKLDASRTDAQGIVEGQPATMAKAWARRTDASKTAALVIRAATPDEGLSP